MNTYEYPAEVVQARAEERRKIDAAIADVRPHVLHWIAMLEAYVDSLPPDGPEGAGEADRSFAEHELRAMRRDLGALLAVAR